MFDQGSYLDPRARLVHETIAVSVKWSVGISISDTKSGFIWIPEILEISNGMAITFEYRNILVWYLNGTWILDWYLDILDAHQNLQIWQFMQGNLQ